MQDIFNLLPNTNTADLAKAFAVQTNDMMVVVYLSALIRSVIALHNLVNNRYATCRTGQDRHHMMLLLTLLPRVALGLSSSRALLSC
jgi:hypothetical protein